MNLKSIHLTHPVFLLALVLVLGATLRFYGLSRESLWNDELSSWYRSHFESISAVIDQGVRPDVHPPGYPVFLYYLEKHAGTTEWVLRFPSALAGVLSIGMMFVLGRRLYGEREGLIGAALTAVLWCPVYYSQEARMYSLLLLAAIAATYFWLSMVSETASGRRAQASHLVGYAVTATAASYLHYFGLLLVLLQAVAAVLSLRRRRGRLAAAALVYAVVLLGYAPWLLAMFEQLAAGAGSFPRPGPLSFLEFLGFLFNRSRGLLIAVLMFYSVLVYRDGRSLVRNARRPLTHPPHIGATLFLIGWLCLPFMIVYIKSVVSYSVMNYKSLIISLPAAYLLLARSIERIPLRPVYRSSLAAAIVGILLFHLIGSRHYFSRPHKAQFREAAAYVADRSVESPGALIVGRVWRGDYLNYYFERKGSGLEVDMVAGDTRDTTAVWSAAQRTESPFVWLVAAHRIPDEEFLRFMRRAFDVLEHEKFIDAEVWLFRKSE